MPGIKGGSHGLERISDPVVSLDRDFRIQWINAAAGRLLGLDPRSVAQTPLTSSAPKLFQEVLGPLLLQALQENRPVRESTTHPEDHQPLDVCLYPDATGVTLILHREDNLSDQERDEAEILRMVAPQSGDVLAVVDAQGAIVHQSAPFSTRLGFPPTALKGQRLADLVVPEDRDGFALRLKETLAEGNGHLIEFRMRRKDGTRRMFEGTLDLVHGSRSGRGFVVLVARDITEQKEMEQTLRRNRELLAQHSAMLERLSFLDAETGIANRRGFDEAFEKEWARARRNQDHVSLILAEIDYFDAYRQSQGLPTAELTLRKLTRILQESINRPCDLVARFSANTFVLILPDTKLEGAKEVATRIERGLADQAIHHPSRPGTAKVITLSLGVASMTAKPGIRTESLLGGVDRALYLAKSQGGHQIVALMG